MMKKIIFFDGDGTLWYPKKTKYSRYPAWIYGEYRKDKLAWEQLILTPTTIQTLKKLKNLGIKLVILSTSSYPPKKANKARKKLTKFLGIFQFFDEIYGTRENYDSKGKFIIRILKKHKLSKKDALMVGDTYNWDYYSAKKIGVDALLVEHNYEKYHKNYKKVKRKIKQLKDVLKYI